MSSNAILETALEELCEPVFGAVCEARSAEGEAMQPEVPVRVQHALAQAETYSRVQPGLERSFELIRHDMYFFADHVLGRRFPGWRSLAAERFGIVAGDEIFCQDLEELLETPAENRDALAVLRTCVALGFNGSDVVGDKQWQRTLKELARALPAETPDSPATAGRLAVARRRGPARGRWWPILLFLILSGALLSLAAWQVWRAPAAYRQRLVRLGMAAGSGHESVGFWVPSPEAGGR